MEKFKLKADFNLMADQISACESLVKGIKENKRVQVLLGATGTGKTFTIANVIARVNKPALIFAHNKTLAGQLYSEFKELFPENHVEYFVSNFDYYQPEAYIPKSDTYIEKSSQTNDELDMLRMAAYNAALRHRDTIIIASVACIYGSGDPESYENMFFSIKVGQIFPRNDFLKRLVELQYHRNDLDSIRGSFKVRGDSVEIFLGHRDDLLLRVEFFDDEIERILEIEPTSKKIKNAYKLYNIFPAQAYSREKKDILRACDDIEKELAHRLEYFKENNLLVEYERLKNKTNYDLETLREVGYCQGIENYSMHIDNRKPGERPYNLFDYFKNDFLLIVDESHQSLPQIRAMYGGDRSRKETLVKYGFRLPSALENRPMRFEEFEEIYPNAIFISATPGDYELNLVNNKVIEQIIRPTGLVDPTIEVRSSKNQISDLFIELDKQIAVKERVLITVATVNMAKQLVNELQKFNYKAIYLHHEDKTLERIEKVNDLRRGKYDILVGINLLREGLDIPEVSLVCIMDADYEGFLRSTRSLIQIIGRAARNKNGRVIMYADKISDSMQEAIDETNRRRKIQLAYNEKHNIIPKSVSKPIRENIHSKESKRELELYRKTKDKKALSELIKDLEKEMKEAASQMDFERAIELRDIIHELKAS